MIACRLRFAMVDPSLTTRSIGGSTRLLVNLAIKTAGSNINADVDATLTSTVLCSEMPLLITYDKTYHCPK